MLAFSSSFVFALAVLVAVLKGRNMAAAFAVGALIATTAIGAAVIGTVRAAEAPFGDAWLVVILLIVSWMPALYAACGSAAEGSWWARSGRPLRSAPALETLGNFVWVFAIIGLGILFEGIEILGAVIFCALFGAMLAAVLLFGLGAARVRAA